MSELEIYLAALKDAGLIGKVSPVVELFEQTEGPPISDKPFEAQPAAWDRIRSQIQLERRFARGFPIGFSVPEYMTPLGGKAAGELYSRYLTELKQSGRSLEGQQ